jgi:hypothetical protein
MYKCMNISTKTGHLDEYLRHGFDTSSSPLSKAFAYLSYIRLAPTHTHTQFATQNCGRQRIILNTIVLRVLAITTSFVLHPDLTFNTTFEQLQLLPQGPKILDHPLPTNLRRHRAHKDLLPLNLLLPPGVLLQLLLKDLLLLPLTVLLLLLLRVLSPFLLLWLLPLLPERHKFHPL